MRKPTNISGKNNIILVLIVLPLIFLTACSQGGLKENTSGVLGPGTFYKTKSDFNAAIIPMYRYFSGAFRNAQGQLAMYGGDDLTTRSGSNKGQFRQWDRFNYNARSGWLESFTYKPYWKTIHTANTILANLDEASLSQDFINRVSGQAHFMRGLSYYMLVRQFGGMPLITSAKSTGKEGRESVEKTYKLIEKDMKEAESNLPKTWSAAAGKPTSGGAKTVLASLYLTWAGWPVKDNSKYAMAAKKAKEVMGGGTYGLLNNYADLWKTSNDNNKESIFAIQFDLKANNFSTTLAQSYTPLEEKGYVDGQAEIGLFKRMPPGPRKEATYLTTFTKTKNGEKVKWQNSQLKHPTFKKWTIGGRPKGGSPHKISGQNVPLFRYAQVLLIYAEAEDMANGPNSQAYSAINKVRERAGLDDLSPGLSQQQFQEAVIRERSYEFAGEFTRWFDEVRTETVKKYSDMRAPSELPLVNEPTKQYYISPIPATEVQQDPNLNQYDKGYPTGDQVK